jgi:hypothetical protein
MPMHGRPSEDFRSSKTATAAPPTSLGVFSFFWPLDSPLDMQLDGAATESSEGNEKNKILPTYWLKIRPFFSPSNSHYI